MDMVKKNKGKILFIRNYPSSFIQEDIKILRKYFNVKVVDFILNRKDPKNTLKTVFSMIVGTIWADIVFSWFADLHSFYAVKLSKIFRKRSIVVIGGYETAGISEIGYGALLNPKTVDRIKYVFKNSDRIVSLTGSLKKEAMEEYEVDGTNFTVIPTGFDYNLFKSKGKKENLVFTAALGDTYERARLKGIDTFVKSAKFLPDVKFIVNGITGDALEKLKRIASPNVDFIGPVSFEELIGLFQKSKVYCQLSMREGLPTAVCEAMLCECIPVGTEVQGIITAMGDTGFYVSYGNVEGTSEAINKALKSDKGKFARERIIEKFPLSQRETELKRIINNF